MVETLLEQTVRRHPCSGSDHRQGSLVIVRIAYVSTYPPRRCGIATFTHDLAAAAGSREIVALHGPEEPVAYPLEVHHRIRRDERSDYARIASGLRSCVDAVSIQHEYGIWGGEDGEYVLDFIDALTVPASVTLHTVLRSPTPRQRAILTQLVRKADATVVMSNAAADVLGTTYGVDPGRIEIIPHGVPNIPLVDSATIKPSLGLEGRDVILSFGLLGPGKGFELAIDALPDVVARHPRAMYVMVGATHPDLLRREGEAYRDGLTARAQALGMSDHVRFVDRFVSRVELIRWLEAADVFVTPYPNLDQIVSGTLSYAMGAGRVVVSTPYAYAAEMLSEGRGVLVQPGSPTRFAAALHRVLRDDAMRAEIGGRAYAFSRRKIWSEIGAEYHRMFDRIRADTRVRAGPSPFATVNA